MEPRELEAVCHDGTPFLTVQCSWCRMPNHLHESQTVDWPHPCVVDMRCEECGRLNAIRSTTISLAFWRMRHEGWIPGI